MQTIDRNEIAKDINAKISGLGRNIRTKRPSNYIRKARKLDRWWRFHCL